jgi:hypothetical protein
MQKNNFFWRSVDFQVGSGIRNLKAIEQYLNAGAYGVDEAKTNEEAISKDQTTEESSNMDIDELAELIEEEAAFLGVLESGGKNQQIPKLTPSLKNVMNFSLDRIDSELFLPRTNVQN